MKKTYKWKAEFCSLNVSCSSKDYCRVQEVNWRQMKQRSLIGASLLHIPTEGGFQQTRFARFQQVICMELERGSSRCGIFAWMSVENNYCRTLTSWAARSAESQSGSGMQFQGWINKLADGANLNSPPPLDIRDPEHRGRETRSNHVPLSSCVVLVLRVGSTSVKQLSKAQWRRRLKIWV